MENLVVPNLPPIITKNERKRQLEEERLKQLEEKHKDEPIEDVKAPQPNKMIIILSTADISDDERDILKKFGRVRDYNYSMFNINLSTLEADYLLVDVRDKLNKLHIQRVNVDNFNWVAYVHSFQKHDNIFDDFIENINIISKIPNIKVAHKYEFDELLITTKKIKSTNCLISLISFLLNGVGSILKK